MPNRFLESLEKLAQNEAAVSAPPAPAETRLLQDIAAKMPPKNRGSAAGFYLEKQVVQGIDREAKRRGITKSKLVNEILKRVLFEP
jgi:hypothetical protein